MIELTERAEALYRENRRELQLREERVRSEKELERKIETLNLKIMLIGSLLCQARNLMVCKGDDLNIQELKDISLAAYELSQRT